MSLLSILCYVIPVIIVAMGLFYTGKKKKEVCQTLQQIRLLVELYQEAKEDGTITKEEMKSLLDRLVLILGIWAPQEK